jgi:prepilin-type N-terminal cleavage/methylation domain-containing protein
MNFSSSIGNLKNTMSGFTLVELIVVITILAILGTIGFVSIQGYSSSARESGRLSDLTNLEKLLEIKLTLNSYIPPPDASSITLYASGAIIGYQGYAGANVLSGIGMSSNTLDPLDKKYYTYSTNASRTKYQLLGLMENNSTLAINDIGNSLIPVAYAGYDTRYPVTK